MEEVKFTLEDYLEVASLADIRDLYSRKGIPIERNQKGIDIICRDWNFFVTSLWEVAKSQKVPNKIRPLEVDIDSDKYRLFGVFHGDPTNKNSDLPRGYERIVRRSKGSRRVVTEQNLSSYFGIDSVEAPDHVLLTRTQRFLEGLNRGIKDKQMYSKFAAGVDLFYDLFHVPKNKRYSLSERKGGFWWENPEGLSLPQFLNATLSMPYQTRAANFPVHVKYSIVSEDDYTIADLRSAYMAEFLIASNLEDGFFGFAHIPETAYFLQHRIKNSRVVDLANEHAELARTDPQKFAKLCEHNFTYRKIGLRLGKTIKMFSPT